MLDTSPLWPADLDHLRIDSPAPQALAEFYARALGMSVSPLGDDAYLAEGRQRRLVIGRGEARGHPWSAFALEDDAQLERYRRFVIARGGAPLPSPTPLFAQGGFAVGDPDGRLAVFGVRGDRGALLRFRRCRRLRRAAAACRGSLPALSGDDGVLSRRAGIPDLGYRACR